MAKVFLTGAVQVGKSTVIDRVLERLAVSFGGIRTRRVVARDGNVRFLLFDCMTAERFEFARRGPEGLRIDPSVFETAGRDAIRRAVDRADVIVLDELGRMELGAPEFQREVFAAIESPKPLLGVIKPERNPFLDAIRAKPGVEVVWVTEANREELVDTLIRRIDPRRKPEGEVRR